MNETLVYNSVQNDWNWVRGYGKQLKNKYFVNFWKISCGKGICIRRLGRILQCGTWFIPSRLRVSPGGGGGLIFGGRGVLQVLSPPPPNYSKWSFSFWPLLLILSFWAPPRWTSPPFMVETCLPLLLIVEMKSSKLKRDWYFKVQKKQQPEMVGRPPKAMNKRNNLPKNLSAQTQGCKIETIFRENLW